MNIIGTVKPTESNETYFVGWDENERTVYLGSKVSGPWIEIGKDISYESIAIKYAQNYVNSKIDQLNMLYIFD